MPPVCTSNVGPGSRSCIASGTDALGLVAQYHGHLWSVFREGDKKYYMGGGGTPSTEGPHKRMQQVQFRRCCDFTCKST